MQHFCVTVNCQNKTGRPNRKCSTCRWRDKRRSCAICGVHIASSQNTRCAAHRGQPVTPQVAEFASSGFYSAALRASPMLEEHTGQLHDLLNGTKDFRRTCALRRFVMYSIL